jgi:hypothetical protein
MLTTFLFFSKLLFHLPLSLLSRGRRGGDTMRQLEVIAEVCPCLPFKPLPFISIPSTFVSCVITPSCRNLWTIFCFVIFLINVFYASGDWTTNVPGDLIAFSKAILTLQYDLAAPCFEFSFSIA